MRSTTGQYFQSLDHVRAVAAFLVFVWHFNHVGSGQLESPLSFPLSILTEGHVGVGLFLVLSGYMFAKLLDGKNIVISAFLWNRFIRLFPLLAVAFTVYGLQLYVADGKMSLYALRLVGGLVFPVWPNGGWSIIVEVHFYLLLPILLFLSRYKYSLIALVIMAIAIRVALYSMSGSIQHLAYFTLIGRIDQFLIGIFVWHNRGWIKDNNLIGMSAIIIGLILVYIFDKHGGFYGLGGYPSKSTIWIIIPTIEAILFATIICWYNHWFNDRSGVIFTGLAKIGQYSFSIYILHFFYVFAAAKFIDEHIISLENGYLRLVAATITFFVFLPVSHLSHEYFEKPILKLRKQYIY